MAAAPDPTPSTPPDQPVDAPATAPEPAAGGEPTEARLTRAMAAEVAALRRRLADVPEPDDLAALRQKAAQFDALAGDLPAWREQVAQAIESQRTEGTATLRAAQEQLARAKDTADLQSAFFSAGGRPEAWSLFNDVAGKHVHRADDGSLVIATEQGDPEPITAAMDRFAKDGMFAGMFRAKYGAGGGSRGNHSARAVPGVNFGSLSTDQKFQAAFGRR